MSNQVYANGMEVSCKSADSKSICEFPDVCFTPPQTPATPPGVPIPYPNTGMASDTTSGSTTVKIGGQEVMLKNKSYFKRSMGDEAGCAPKKGVITSTNMGKVYFVSWSMDVIIEGENVVRMGDMTTHNHGSTANGAVPTVHIGKVAIALPNTEACKKEAENVGSACANATPLPKKDSGRGQGMSCSEECKAKQKCILVPKGDDKNLCCSPETTGDHLIEDHWIWKDEKTLMPDFSHLENKPKGAYNGAPTMCVNASRFKGLHGVGHGTRGVLEDAEIGKSGDFTYARGKEIALQGHRDQCNQAKEDTGTDPNCNSECTAAQLDAFYGKDGDKKLHKPNRKQALKPEQRSAAKKRISDACESSEPI
jgi:uncharacterized Zn-binding protein involved in type VI secretion